MVHVPFPSFLAQPMHSSPCSFQEAKETIQLRCFSPSAGRYGVRGFPTIKLFYSEQGKQPAVVDYEGNRTPDDFVDFALRHAKKVAQKRLGRRTSGKEPPPRG